MCVCDTCMISLELLYGIKIVVHGDIKTCLSSTRPTIITMNHRTRFDWLYLWSLLLRVGSLRRQRITLKWPLKFVPFFGKSILFSLYNKNLIITIN